MDPHQVFLIHQRLGKRFGIPLKHVKLNDWKLFLFLNLIKSFRFSSKSDVWAFGVLCWEVFTCGEMPYGRAKNPEVVERVQRGQILSRPPQCPHQVYEVNFDKDLSRPLFSASGLWFVSFPSSMCSRDINILIHSPLIHYTKAYQGPVYVLTHCLDRNV